MPSNLAVSLPLTGMDNDAYTGRRRKQLRLLDFDYATPGSYFITIVLETRVDLLASLVDGSCRLTEAGQFVDAEWKKLPARFPGLALDEHIVMPDHVHGLLTILPVPGQRPNVSDVINAFKSITTVEYGRQVREHHWPPFRKRLWQRGFFDEIIRDERHMQNVHRYIRDNPAQCEAHRRPF